MSDAKGQHEPSMEEILASIRRIIAEDNETPAEGEEKKPAAAASQPVDDILELTEVVEDETPEPAEAPLSVVPAEPEPEPEPEPELHHQESLGPMAEDEERLISATSAAVSVAALSQLVNRGAGDRSGELPLGALNRTLEDMVRELLRPLLKGWLDENLPPMVERLVQEEIARLVREAHGR
jgi:uncharacterized protein